MSNEVFCETEEQEHLIPSEKAEVTDMARKRIEIQYRGNAMCNHTKKVEDYAQFQNQRAKFSTFVSSSVGSSEISSSISTCSPLHGQRDQHRIRRS